MNELKVEIERDKESGDWRCVLTGPGGPVVLYQGTNANKAADIRDDVEKVIAGVVVQAVAIRVGDDRSWTVMLESVLGIDSPKDVERVTLRDFGKGGANKAMDWCDEVSRAIKTP